MDYQFKTQQITCQGKKGDRLLFNNLSFVLRKILMSYVFYDKGGKE